MKRNSDSLSIPCYNGSKEAYEGDSVGITFAKSGRVHNPVTHSVSRAITTMCDHDIGVVVLSDAMQKYIVSEDGKYVHGKLELNPSVARCITTREGTTRADASTYLSPDCGEDTEITADEDGYPVAILDEYNHSVSKPDVCPTIQAKYPVPNHGPRLMFLKEEDDMSRKDLDIADTDGVAKTITATVQKNHKGTDNFIPTWEDDGSVAELSEEDKDIVVGTLRSKGFNEMTGRVHSPDGVSPTVRTFCGGGQETKVDVTLLGGFGEKKSNGGTQYYEQDRVYDTDGVATSIPAEKSFHPNYADGRSRRLTIRKLTPGECYRLMGFEQADLEACRAVGQSDTNIFHQAGDSIVTTVLMGLFGELLGIEYRDKISEYVERLHAEVSE